MVETSFSVDLYRKIFKEILACKIVKNVLLNFAHDSGVRKAY